MPYKISAVDVYAVDVMNRPGMLARVLEALTLAGANLEFVIARRVNENTSRVFLSPLKGTKVLRAAADLGLRKADGMHAIRVQGPDAPGLGARLSRGVADAGLNMRGFSGAAAGKTFIGYIAFATAEDARQGLRAAKKATTKRRR